MLGVALSKFISLPGVQYHLWPSSRRELKPTMSGYFGDLNSAQEEALRKVDISVNYSVG